MMREVPFGLDGDFSHGALIGRINAELANDLQRICDTYGGATIAAVVVGGTSLFGGRGSVWNAILGALVIGSVGNGLDLGGATAADKFIISGAILLEAIEVFQKQQP